MRSKEITLNGKELIVYEDGRVYRKPYTNFCGHQLKGGFAKVSLGENGYERISVGSRNYNVHRLLAMAFIPNPENKPQVNHINGIKTDNRIENLEWNTARENNVHAVNTGLRVTPKGEAHYKSKLKEDDVRQIRKKLKEGHLQKDMAKMFNVPKQTISRIKLGKAWKHVK